MKTIAVKLLYIALDVSIDVCMCHTTRAHTYTHTLMGVNIYMFYAVFNKYRKRHLHNTVNLITGEADVAPGALKVHTHSLTHTHTHIQSPPTCVHTYISLLQVPQGATDVPPDILSYYHPNLTISIVDDHTDWTPGSVPQPMDKCKQHRHFITFY